MMLSVPLMTKTCSVIVLLIASYILIAALISHKTEDEKYRRRWMLLAISCMTWGILVWFPLIPAVAEHTRVQTAIYLLRLLSLFIGIWVFIGLYNAGELNLKKRKTNGTH